MAANDPVVNRIRIIPRKDDFLDRNVGASGEIYYSSDVDTLRLYSGNDKGGFEVVTENNLRRNTAAQEVASIKYTVTIDNQTDISNRYVLNGEYHTSVTFMRGYTYIFDQTDQTNVYYPNAEGGAINTHPLLFSITEDGTHASPTPGVAYETGVIYLIDNLPVTQAQYISKFSSATSRKVQITATVDTPDDLYYYCYYHSGMGKDITTSLPGTGTGGANITVSDTAPVEPTNGNLWYKSDDGKLLVYVTDADSSQWVQPSVPVAETNSGQANTFKTITTSDSTSLVASGESTLTLAEGSGMQITTNDQTNTITFENPYTNLQAITEVGATSTVDVTLANVKANGYTRQTSRLTGESGATDHNTANGAVFVHSSPTGVIVPNFLNLNLQDEDELTIRLVLVQSGTPHVPITCTIDGVSQTVFWDGGTNPTGTANGYDIIDFTILRDALNSYTVLAKHTSYDLPA